MQLPCVAGLTFVYGLTCTEQMDFLLQFGKNPAKFDYKWALFDVSYQKFSIYLRFMSQVEAMGLRFDF